MLNVDGYDVLSVDEASDTVSLNQEQLRTQLRDQNFQTRFACMRLEAQLITTPGKFEPGVVRHCLPMQFAGRSRG